MSNTVSVLDHGYVKLLNIAGPSGPADDIDPANAARMSFNQKDSGRTREDDLRLCDYLLRNWHTTPFEMVQVWLEMKLPIFVARQFVRHRTASINEISGRYVELPKEWYLPTFYKKADSKKQGRANEVHHNSGLYATVLNEHCEQSYEEYRAAIAEGVAPEQARLFLHVNHYTKWIWRQDLHNLFHFLSLRDHEHAQWEAQQYAKAIDTLLRAALPDLMSLYDKHRRQQ